MSSTPEGFILPAAFGPNVDWLKNLRATPEARLYYEGVTYPVEAEVIDLDEALRRAGGSPGCSCWTQFNVQQFALMRPDGTGDRSAHATRRGAPARASRAMPRQRRSLRGVPNRSAASVPL